MDQQAMYEYKCTWDMYPKPGMSYESPSINIDSTKYDEVISIGNKCPTAMLLRDLKVYKRSYPFDYVSTTPKLILKYLKDTAEFFPKKGEDRTKDLVYFGHFDTNEKYEETIQSFKRRFERLFTALKEKKRILFVYTSEANIYNEMGNRYSDNYGDLIQLQDYIKDKYQYNDFTILAIHVNKVCENTKNIINYNTTVSEEFLSNNMESHMPHIFFPYRTTLLHLFKEIFKL